MNDSDNSSQSSDEGRSFVCICGKVVPDKPGRIHQHLHSVKHYKACFKEHPEEVPEEIKDLIQKRKQEARDYATQYRQKQKKIKEERSKNEPMGQ